MLYEEAVKKVKEIRAKDSKKYILLNFGYSSVFAVPYEQGINIISSMNQALKVDTPYSSAPTVAPVSTEDITFKIMTEIEIQDMYIAQLLNIPIKELANAREAI